MNMHRSADKEKCCNEKSKHKFVYNDKARKDNIVITASALQDHMSRCLSLKNPKFTKKDRNSSVMKGASLKNKSRTGMNSECRVSKNVLSNDANAELVLDPRPEPLTLAQKLGIVVAPEPALTENQWKHVKDASNSRNDSSQPCVICKEKFGLEQQVLLSCSHVFHRVCLQSFERYSGKKSCPMCRKEKYQTRLIHDAANIHMNQAAIIIQSCWRGYVVRRWYRDLRETTAPNDPILRKAFFEKKLTSITETILNTTEQQACDVDSLINTSDDNLAYSRSIIRQLGGSRNENFVDWNEVEVKASKHEIHECPICMSPLQDQPDEQRNRPVVLLSCSHIFHSVCLQMYEDCYPAGRHQCPMCRTYYVKRNVLQGLSF